MINFTVGPVQSNDIVCKIGSEQVPYFRTTEFSKVILECEEMIKEFSNAPKDSRVVFITGSGTASMEASIINTLTSDDKVLVINGGTFGQRFVDLLEIHKITFDQIKIPSGKNLDSDVLMKYDNKGYTAFIVNVHETSTGVYYDINLISDFCKRNNLFLIVDAVSSFIADSFDMCSLKVDVMITGSQKALACPPGVSIIVLSSLAVQRVYSSTTKCMYLDLKEALNNAERGQTPFTPAVGILRQIHARLIQIKSDGGIHEETKRIAELADYFRNKIKELPFEIVSESMSNAVTPLHPFNASAYDIFTILKDKYDIWVCPNGGEMRDEIFRVGHIGSLTKKDYDILIDALNDMQDKGLI